MSRAEDAKKVDQDLAADLKLQSRGNDKV